MFLSFALFSGSKSNTKKSLLTPTLYTYRFTMKIKMVIVYEILEFYTKYAQY